MFTKIKLFGITLDISADGSIAPPVLGNVKVKQWSCKLPTQNEADLTFWIEINSFFTLTAEIAIAIKANATGDAVPNDSPQLAGRTQSFRLWDRLFASQPFGSAVVVRVGG